jgi:hypothetical protein
VRRRGDNSDVSYTRLLSNFREDGTEDRSRENDLREDPGPDAELLQERPCPITPPGVIALSCRGVCEFNDVLTCQEEIEKIGDHQKLLCYLEKGRVRTGKGDEVIERIDREKLDPGLSEDLLPGDNLKNGLHHPFCLRITIGIREAQKCPGSSDQGKINAPRIQTDTLEGEVWIRGTEGKGMFHLLKELENIPVEMVKETEHPVRKTVNLFKLQSLTIKSAEDRPPTGSTEVKG